MFCIKSNLLVIRVQLWSVELSWVFDPLREVTPLEFCRDCEWSSETKPLNLCLSIISCAELFAFYEIRGGIPLQWRLA